MIKGFSLSYSKGSAWLTVYPRQEGDRTVYSDEIRARMKILGIPPVRNSIIEEILQNASGEPEKLVPWPGGEALSTRCSLETAEDGMTAWLTVTAPRPGGEEITADLIDQALGEGGIVKGILRDSIERIVTERLYGRKIVIARGTEPVHGRGARVKYHFVTEHIPYRELLFGRIDLKELNYIQNRKEGDLLAELLPKEDPRDGYTVTGEILPADPADKGEEIKAGEGTRVEENRLIAAPTETPVWKRELLS